MYERVAGTTNLAASKPVGLSACELFGVVLALIEFKKLARQLYRTRAGN
jgi:hypothetical protein